ncbi:hypothetical protein R3P38DRAFT_2796060 [Favolaschia claudopus]|uniref:Uncharacterized protein n=1 Tax=Favolaschia claudopus TaxID=2862362 RepID=A0AAW0A5R9_9AGAR
MTSPTSPRLSPSTLLPNIMILTLVSGTQGFIIGEHDDFDDNTHWKVRVIIGGVVGGVALIITLIFLLFYYQPRRRAARFARVEAVNVGTPTSFVAGAPAGSYVVGPPPAAYAPATHGFAHPGVGGSNANSGAGVNSSLDKVVAI